MKKHILLILLLLLGGLNHVFAQTPAPEWLSQIKLSGLSGSTDQRLALINGKTFSQGEANNLKVAGKTVVVKCLEIREQSVLVQIEDLPSRYELTIAGGILAVDTNPVTAGTSPPVARIESPAPVSVPPVKPLIFSEATHPSQSIIKVKTFPLTAILFVTGLFFALVVGIALGSTTTRWQQRKDEGEAKVADTIGRYFPRAHLLLNNVTLPIASGTTQIDHILVADTGIFVIETKHYTGWIFGDPKEKQWTQTIYRKKSSFQNPVHQNYGHVKALQALFDLPENHFYSVVVFTADAEFKTDLGPNVVRLAGLIPFLNTERPVVLDEGQRASIIGYIEMKRERRSVETDEYHINHLRSRFPPNPPGVAKSK